MKQTRKLLCLMTLLLCLVAKGWAQESVSQDIVYDSSDLVKGSDEKTATFTKTGCFTMEINTQGDRINKDNFFKFGDGGTFTITPDKNVEITSVKGTVKSGSKLNGVFNVNGEDSKLTTTTGYATPFKTATTFTYSGSSKTSIEKFTITYTTDGGGGQITKDVTIGTIDDKNPLLVGESYTVDNPTAVESGTEPLVNVDGTFTYSTTAENVKINGNEITGVSEGPATINVDFTPKNTETTTYNKPTKIPSFTVTVSKRTVNLTCSNAADAGNISVGKDFIPTMTATEDGTTTSVDGTISYSSSDEAIASINGTSIKGEKAGTATITATFTPSPENSTKYKTATATFDVTVKEAETPASGSKEITYDKVSPLNNSVASFTCDAFKVSFNCKSKINSSNYFQFKSTKDAIYSFTIEPIGDYSVTKVVADPTGAPFSVSVNGTLVSSTLFTGTYDKEITEKTVFASTNTGSTDKITSFTIYYTKKSSRKNVTLEGSFANKTIKADESCVITTDEESKVIAKDGETQVTGTFSYTTTNTDIVTIDPATKAITGLKFGTATITATFNPDGSEYNTAETTFEVSVEKRPITLTCDNASEAGSLSVDEIFTPVVTAMDGNTEVAGTVTNIVEKGNASDKISIKGNSVTGVANGNATITVTFTPTNTDKYDAKTIDIDITVKTAEVETGALTSIRELREKGIADGFGKKIYTLEFDKEHPAIIEFVNTQDYQGMSNGKGDVFITDNSGMGVRMRYSEITNSLGKSKLTIKDTGSKDVFKKNGSEYDYKWKGGDTFIGTIYCRIKSGDSNYPDLTPVTTGSNVSSITVSLNAQKEITPVEVTDVNTLSKDNQNGVLSKAAYKDYLCTVISVPGVIARKGKEYYLLQDDKTTVDAKEKVPHSGEAWRIYFDNSQSVVENTVIDKYLGTQGKFTGILGKRDKGEAKLIMISSEFFKVTEVIFDEDKEAPDLEFLAKEQDLSKVTVKIHRTGIKPLDGDMWNTICLPITVSVKQLNAAAEIVGINSSLTSVDLATFSKNIKDGYMQNTVTTGATTIEKGIPYLVRFKGAIEVNTDITQDSYYLTFLEQNLEKENVIANPKVTGTYKTADDTQFVGLYGIKLDAYDNGSQKWQYISTKNNYLLYLGGDVVYDKNEMPTKNYFKGLRAVYHFDWWTEDAEEQASLSKLFSFSSFVTGIDGIENKATEKNCKVYNMNGQFVGTSTKGLPKGIYIVNGRKFIAK